VSLVAAHRGYEYQDLLVAYRLVDVVLGSVQAIKCDVKLFDGDRFDDLTTLDSDGHRERVQFKHRGASDAALELEDFSSDRRSLRLDKLLASILEDRASCDDARGSQVYRVLVSDPSLAGGLAALLQPTDVAPFVARTRTSRFRFDADALWAMRSANSRSSDAPFAFVFADEEKPLAKADLEWATERLVVEAGAPTASFDLTEPGEAEERLLERVISEVGAESFPNQNRSAVDVAAALVSAARAARQNVTEPTAVELLRRTQLRTDFGAVSRSDPVDARVAVARPATVAGLSRVVAETAATGGIIVVQGPPGHGKSWVCRQVLDRLESDGWLAAEHYCYLGEADAERDERVLGERMFGSLLGRLAEGDSRLVDDQRPRFAADEEAVVRALGRARQLDAHRPIAIVVDGLDHVTRVRGSGRGAYDPSLTLAEALASLRLPDGVVLIVLSQPGAYLDPLVRAGAVVTDLPGLTADELEQLALNCGLGNAVRPGAGSHNGRDDDAAMSDALAALAERARGNALYATYLCREALRVDVHIGIDAAATIRALPEFDGTLANYYTHLYSSLGPESGWVADVIALIDFGVTRVELKEIRPDAAHRIDAALEVLRPVLVERATQGGLRVYHESFARFLREPFQHEPAALRAVLEAVIRWLEPKGLFRDQRAFRSLLRLHLEAGNAARVVEIVGHDFVVEAIAAGFPASAIADNLAAAVAAAGVARDWPSVIRFVEMSRAAETFEYERFDTTLIDNIAVPAAVIGADTLADRLLHEGRCVLPARAALQMCSALDRLGVAPPWGVYMDRFTEEHERDNTQYGAESDHAVGLAWLRGRLRSEQSDADVSALAGWVDEAELDVPQVVEALVATLGWPAVLEFEKHTARRGEVCLAVAERLAKAASTTDPPPGSADDWAMAAVREGVPRGSAHRLLALGLDVDVITAGSIADARESLAELTSKIQHPRVQWEPVDVMAWCDGCAIAARRDPLGLDATEAAVRDDGWYWWWLRFVIGLARAEAAGSPRCSEMSLAAIRLLAADLRPFAGDPRSCDLYALHGVIGDTITRAVALLDGDDWPTALGVLRGVSDGITTSLFGEAGGPVPADFVIELAVDGGNDDRFAAAEALIAGMTADGAGGRFYADIADQRLMSAKLALAAGDLSATRKLWHEACTFLAGYGWHKDVTIYEVLDPFPALISADVDQARARLGDLQGLCERVPLHTDGRETRGAWSRWWSLAAKADPVAAVRLAALELCSQSNDANSLAMEALQGVWVEWQSSVAPAIAGALRLALEVSLAEGDARLMARVVAEGGGSQRLVPLLLARTDERALLYHYTDGHKMVARDEHHVAQIVEAAGAVGAAGHPVVDEASGSEAPEPVGRRRGRGSPDLESAPPRSFPAGLPGLESAIREWRRRPYDATSAAWSQPHFANAIGYRLVELEQSERSADAASAIRALADASAIGDRNSILEPIARGLDRHGLADLAALAYTLAWTRTRGGGGWLSFGGKDNLDLLRRASVLSPEVAREAILSEIQRAVALPRYGTHGIGQAIIFAIADSAIPAPPGTTGTELAFSTWDAAFEVISSRAPRVAPSDDPEWPYTPSEAVGTPATAELESSFALAVLGCLAAPARETKRRALLAVEQLLSDAPGALTEGLPHALGAISDAPTLTWLLSTIARHSNAPLVCRDSHHVLKRLAQSDRLTVRAIARSLVDDPPPVPSSTVHPARHTVAGDAPSPDARRMARSTLDQFAGVRLAQADDLLEAFSTTVHDAALLELTAERTNARMSRQLRHLTSAGDERWPDAVLAIQEAVEECVQAVAASSRAHALVTGQPVGEPVLWEARLASAVLDDPFLPVRLEASRLPRPDLSPPPPPDAPLWTSIRDDAGQAHPSHTQGAVDRPGWLSATLAINGFRSAATATTPPFAGWRWIATFESRSFKPPERTLSDSLSQRLVGLELRADAEDEALDAPPFAFGGLDDWRTPVASVTGMLDRDQPLLALDFKSEALGDGRATLGRPPAILVPSAVLAGWLGLRPGAPFSFGDDHGPGLALCVWRTNYEVSDYHLTFPRVQGAGILLRPDLFERLAASEQRERLVIRDFVTRRALEEPGSTGAPS
jgi:hypothetical protein